MTNHKKVVTFFLLTMIGVMVIFIGLWIRGKGNRTTIINVEGFEIEYHSTDRKLSEVLDGIVFYGNGEEGSSIDEISDKFGEPDTWLGNIFPEPVYFLEDDRVAVFHFSWPDVYKKLSYIALYRENGDIRVINADTEQGEESSESIRHFFNTITDDMLNACESDPYSESYWDAYWNDSLILLNQMNEKVKLYGISTARETAMLLIIEGEKVLIEYPFPPFRNLYERLPGLDVCDIDGDERDEVIISLRTACGDLRRDALLVCDYEKKWNVYRYDDFLKDVEDIVSFRVENGNYAFSDNDGNVLWEADWDRSIEFEYASFENDMGFHAGEIAPDIVVDESILLFQNGSPDINTIQMDIVPWIGLKEYSLPVRPIRIVFYVRFADGDFEITGYACYQRANRK